MNLFVKLRVETWILMALCIGGRGEANPIRYHVHLTIQLAVSVLSVPSGNKACDISEVLVYWRHTDLMVRSCSIIICSVCIIWYHFNQWMECHKHKLVDLKRRERELYMEPLLKHSSCFWHPSSAVEASPCNTGERKILFLKYSALCVFETLRSTTKFVPAVRLSVWNKSKVLVEIFMKLDIYKV
jgi:hypothetical protein